MKVQWARNAKAVHGSKAHCSGNSKEKKENGKDNQNIC
jgi:hypothetical protein